MTKLTHTTTTLEELVAENIEPHSAEPTCLELPLEDGTQPLVYDPYNERVKLYGVRPRDIAESSPTEVFDNLASKITIYAPPGEEQDWEEIGFQREAVIRGFFDTEDAHLWAAYTDEQRELTPKEAQHKATVEIALQKQVVQNPVLPQGYESDIAVVDDCAEIATLLDQTFDDYPTPIHQDIIAEQITNEDNVFRVVRNSDGVVAAVASAELDHDRSSAEMTDCATLGNERGKGLMAFILRTLEHDIGSMFGIRDLYTIARADEVGMNCVFSKLGYDFHGRLLNNCRMPNGWESMNVWCLQAKPV